MKRQGAWEMKLGGARGQMMQDFEGGIIERNLDVFVQSIHPCIP